MKSFHFLLLLALVCPVLSGCAGYSLGAQKPQHLRHITKLAVPTFKNDTLEPRLAVLVTNAVIKQLQNHGSYEIVARRDADAVLEGVIHTITRSQFRSDRNKIQATVSSNYAIVESGSGATLHRSTASANSYMILDANMQLSETQLLEDIAQRLAGDVADQISEGW